MRINISPYELDIIETPNLKKDGEALKTLTR
jgi:hypothetical protein